MSTTPMIEQVNRIVGNLLAGGGELFLPGVGSLYTERIPARRISRRMVQPPCRLVSFCSQERGESLALHISRAAQCDLVQAGEIYDLWLARTLEGDMLMIEGVGVLKFKNFLLDADFDRRLNPQGHQPVRVKSGRGFDWALWLGVTALTFVAAGFIVTYTVDPSALAFDFLTRDEPVAVAQVSTSDGVDATEPTASAEAGLPQGDEASDGVVSESPESGDLAEGGAPAKSTDAVAQSTQSSAQAPTTAPQTTQTPAQSAASPSTTASSSALGSPDMPAAFVSGRHYVVLGVFSEPANAARAIRDAAQKEVSVRCTVYRFSGRLLVSPFESDDVAACAQFIRDTKGKIPGMWTYTVK